MDKPAQTSLAKACSICGLVKPISAYVQLASQQGITYGNVCSTCRGSGRDRVTSSNDPSEQTTGSGYKIDSKAKVQGEVDKRQQRQKKQEGFLEDKRKKEKTSLEKTQKLDTNQEAEKKHRENFLSRVQTYLTSTPKTEATKEATTTRQVEAGVSKQFFVSKEKTEATSKMIADEAIREKQMSTVDLTVTHYDPAQGEKKFDNETMRQFCSLLGDAPIVRSLGLIFKNNPNATAKTGQKTSTAETNKTPATKEEAIKEKQKEIVDHIEKNFPASPTSPRRSR